MPARPLYRWKSFYFGILVLSFLALGWWRSVYAAEVVFSDPSAARVFHAGQSGGVVGVGSFDARFFDQATICHRLVAGSATSPLSLWRDPHGHPRYELPSAGSWHSQPTGWSLSASHWLLGSLFLASWSGWIIWRRRRFAQLAGLSPSFENESP